MLKPMRKHFLDQHPANCSCDCPTCSSNSCRPEALDVNWLQSHFLCPKQPLLYGSDHNYNQWKCIELKCDACFLNKPSIILCDRSGFADDTNVMKWEKWEQLDYTRRNLVRPLALQQPGIPVQPVGIPLRYAPEAPKLKQSWVQKEGTITEFFKDFVSQAAEQFMHST